jgi:hypothetical protein
MVIFRGKCVPNDFKPSWENCKNMGCPYHYLKEWDKDHIYDECMIGCLPYYGEIKNDCLFFFGIKKVLDANVITINQLKEFKRLSDEGYERVKISNSMNLSTKKVDFLVSNYSELYPILPLDEG